jgi:hypothetical protein
MDSHRSSLIPGAFEVRVGRPTAQPTIAVAAPLAPSPAAAPVYDRERLEREREGGGAPSERTDMQHRTVLGRLYDLLIGRNR